MQFNGKFWARSNNKMLYIDSSNRRYELAPCFFKPEVLAKYRSLPSKYRIDEGFLMSEDEGWILRSCYTASNGEIYCYLCDLSDLPEEEQAYWQVHNLSDPKGKQSPLAIERDFFCSFENSAKQGLTKALKKLRQIEISIDNSEYKVWEPKENLEQMINEIALPQVEEYKQYRDDFLLPLARLIIEGFQYENLKRWALKLGINIKNDCGVHNRYGSLQLLKQCLASLHDSHKAEKAVKPLLRLNDEKSARSSHGGKSPQEKIVITTKDILNQVTKAIIDISQLLETEINE